MLTPILTITRTNVITVCMVDIDKPTDNYGVLRVRLYLQHGQKRINPVMVTYSGKLRFLGACMDMLEFYIAANDISIAI